MHKMQSILNFHEPFIRNIWYITNASLDFSIYLRGKNEALSTVFIHAENFESAFQMMDFAFFEWLK